MPSLSRDLRRLLEKTIAGENGARQIAEDGAERSLQRLAVDKHEPHTSLTVEERTLRNQLRAHGRQLGDKRDPQRGNQTITHLKQAVAYEHWHRLLFARFLAENDLLLHPEHGVALSLDEVKELAMTEQRDWIEVAADFAQRMLLSAVFRQDDPALRVFLPPEKRQELELKLDTLPREVFLADDSLGWVYQFWQKDAKDAVNDSAVKISADELAPVTQLFTEDYMVLFLLHNTLGAWWTAKRKAEGKSPILPGYEWTYLRLKEDGAPAATAFGGWPKTAREIRVLDPSMGSGHFLTFALPILVGFRMEEESLTRESAVEAVLSENLFGLEIDNRCTQIAAFNLALTAWRLTGYRPLPRLNLACSGLRINAKQEDWIGLAGDDSRLRNAMQRLYQLFIQAPVLGSLVDPERIDGGLFSAEFEQVSPLLEQALSIETSDESTGELAFTAQGILESAKILSHHFTLVVTNVPYLVRLKQDQQLRSYCETYHSKAKNDLATCFLERGLSASTSCGTVALVTPHNWLFLDSYRALREELLSSVEWNWIARLGPRAFDGVSGEVVNVVLVVLTNRLPQPDAEFAAIDASGEKGPSEKAEALRGASFTSLSQHKQRLNPDARIVLGHGVATELMQQYASAYIGQRTGDFARFGMCFWELPQLSDGWVSLSTTVDKVQLYGGNHFALLWEDGKGALAEYQRSLAESSYASGGWKQGWQAWGRRGIRISQMGDLPATIHNGDHFDNNCSVIVPKNPDDLAALWCFCSSPEYAPAVRRIDQALKVTNASLVKVPFDLSYWRSVAAENYPNGLPDPSVGDATQWLFGGAITRADQILHVAVARLLGYRWPRQANATFMGCPSVGPDGIEKLEAPIVPLAAIKGEATGADRLRALLADAFGQEWSATKLAELLSANGGGRLEDWLRDSFFEQHCELFHQRPFIWHIWDGQLDGFHVLVNYHKLDRENLEKLIYSYLGDWLARKRQDVSSGVEGADSLLAAAEHLQNELKRILDGEAPYDIFARWKPIEDQSIGWDPDLGDGVRVNIRPWITAAHLYKAIKPGILRSSPRIKYTKDRGKEPPHDSKEFPWFKSSPDRLNDHHLTMHEKKTARGIQ